MSGRDSLRRLVVIALVVSTVGMTPAVVADPATANEHGDADEYFQTLRAMEGAEAFDQYSEFETLRSFAIAKTQVSDFDAETAAELDAMIRVLESFRRAYEHETSGEYETSLDAAAEVDASVDELADYEQSQAALADLALTRFYENVGDGLRQQADSVDSTPERLELLEIVVTAYEEAGLTSQAAEFRAQYERESVAYERAVETMDDAESDTESFLASCTDCGSTFGALAVSGPGVFSQYVTASDRYQRLESAEALADQHGLEDRRTELAETRNAIGSVRTSLAVAATGLLLTYGLLLGVIALAATSRVLAWRATFEAANVDDVVPMGDPDV